MDWVWGVREEWRTAPRTGSDRKDGAAIQQEEMKLQEEQVGFFSFLTVTISFIFASLNIPDCMLNLLNDTL